MKRLSFTAQLSLDFLFGGVTCLPRVGEETLASDFQVQLGGGTLVYPIVLSRLGLKCHVLINRSSTIQAELAVQLLEQCGIDEIEYVPVLDFDPVMTTAVISLPHDRSFISHNDSRSILFDDQLVFARQKDSPVVFASPSNLRNIKQLKDAGCEVVFDVGWSHDLCLDKFKDVLPFVDYFTPNDKEAMKLTGAENVNDALHILQKYVRYPIVSCGAQGCCTLIDDQIRSIPVPTGIKAIDSTGAGDNFMAGLIFAIQDGRSLLDSVRFANCTGALSTQGLGCYGYPYSLAEVESMLTKSF